MHAFDYGKRTKATGVPQGAKILSEDRYGLIAPNTLSHKNLLDLQRTVGNQGVRRLLAEKKRPNIESHPWGHARGLLALQGIPKPETRPDLQRRSSGGRCAKCGTTGSLDGEIAGTGLQREVIVQ